MCFLVFFFFNDTATTEIYTFPTRRSSDLPAPTNPEYWAGIVYLALIGSVVTFPLHYNLVREIGAGRTAYNAILTISVAMLLSTLFEGYRWTALTAGGMGLAVMGMIIALRAKSR